MFMRGWGVRRRLLRLESVCGIWHGRVGVGVAAFAGVGGRWCFAGYGGRIIIDISPTIEYNNSKRFSMVLFNRLALCLIVRFIFFVLGVRLRFLKFIRFVRTISLFFGFVETSAIASSRC